jgi:hypothetical protein
VRRLRGPAFTALEGYLVRYSAEHSPITPAPIWQDTYGVLSAMGNVLVGADTDHGALTLVETVRVEHLAALDELIAAEAEHRTPAPVVGEEAPAPVVVYLMAP